MRIMISSICLSFDILHYLRMIRPPSPRPVVAATRLTAQLS